MAKLYIVPTPIGNLDDITIRAVKVLEKVDLILCEDTRRSIKLLNHLEINSQLRSHHKFNEHNEVEFIVKKIKITSKDTLVIIHRNKKIAENISKDLIISKEKNYGLSKVIFGKIF